MNETWIEDCHISANCSLKDVLYNHNFNLRRFEYLEVVGLFETGWMIYEHHINHDYGYPNHE